MRFRLTLLLGLGIGYVLGAKAGRERYNQMMEMWNQFMGSPTGQQVSRQVHDLREQAVETFQAKTSEGTEKAKERLASAQSSGGTTSGGTTPGGTTPGGTASPSSTTAPS